MSSELSFPTVISEHTHLISKSSLLFLTHSKSVCESRFNEGNKTKVVFGFICSLIQSVTKVLPVPHAMIN